MAGSQPRLSLATLVGYGALGAPLSALLLPLYINLPTYYAADLGLGFAAVGAVLLVARLWDFISDPLIGWASDHTATRYGRRLPWMAAGLPILLLSVFMLFMPGPAPGAGHLLLWASLLYLGATMINLPHIALGAELSEDYHERARVTGVREALSAVGALAVLGLPVALGLSGASAIGAMGWFLIALTPVALLFLFATVREPPQGARARMGLEASVQAFRANGPFQRLLIAYLLNGIANGLPATLFLLYVEYRLGAEGLAGPLLFLYFASGIAGVPIWLVASRRFGKHRAWLGAMIAAALVFAFVPLLGPGDVTAFVIITLLTGLCLGGDLALPPAMQADVVDIDTAMTGARRAGAYFALWNMATKLALALAVGIAFPLLAVLGFDEGTPAAADTFALALLYAGLPAALKLIAAAIIWGYRFDAAALAKVRAAIEDGRPPRSSALMAWGR